ncbi:glucose transporter lmgt1 [Leptomonas pyrrhocoris]|uniref:Glucose transporter lmgt1 n=1 Tax=Leptomonas pyrrhocoris TaxID=157538 RepID=A0A0M9FX20_LEPPY|nr:glucose transporter lmgt1 [Leptomonas pyrrhocoris]KPA77850.1 glucose transporter lmgt1 [Leptomonas pyrrhocoris]|eukprot:XP_015656289.1 glucose transporter lmgt1 [Leptomonas pyrrhocoris]
MPTSLSSAGAVLPSSTPHLYDLAAPPKAEETIASEPAGSTREAEEVKPNMHAVDASPLPQWTHAVSPPSPLLDRSRECSMLHGSSLLRTLPTTPAETPTSGEEPVRPSPSDSRHRSREGGAHTFAKAASKKAELRDPWVDDVDNLDDLENLNRRDNFDNVADSQENVDEYPEDGAAPLARVTLRGFFSKHNLQVAAVPFVCGIINGYTIGYVAPYTQLYKMSTNCALYTAQKGCESVPFADCMWRTATVTRDDGTTQSLNYCGWPAITCRATYPNDGWMGGGGNTTLAEMRCLQDSRCTWSYSAKECQNLSGYSASDTGVFAGSIIAGSMFGAILGGPLVTSMGTRLTFIISGLLSVACSVMGHVDAATDEFWVLVVERFVIGIFMGLITVACPLYVNTNAAPLYRRKLGTLFQVFTTLGVFLAGTIGLGVGQTVDYDADRSADIAGRMQGLASGQTAVSLAMVCLGFFSAESKVKYGKKAGGMNQNEYSYREMMGPLIMSVVLNCTMRLTGFNAILNFAPSIMGGLGLAPLVGNTIMTVFNFTGTLVAIPLDSFFSIRSIFLFGSCFISCMCLFLCGLPVYPGVASASVTNGCAITGISVFIFGFEVFVGPSFYVLCQEIFPPSFRPRGNSFAQLWQFIINLVINVCYPIAAERFSGGPEGDQHKGQAILFIFFGAVGLICFVIELLFLRLWEEETREREYPAEAATFEKEMYDLQGTAFGSTAAASAPLRGAREGGNIVSPVEGEAEEEVRER